MTSIRQGLIIISLLLLLSSCGKEHPSSFTPAQRHETDSMVKTVHSVKGLDSLNKVMIRQQNTLGQMMVLRQWGTQLRNASRFDEALEKHGEGLTIAEQTGDTLEWVQALNNIGTDYRRMGVLDAAQQYHKTALMMANECSDTSFTARKNRVMSLNGLANVYLTVRNFHLADSCLRQALAGETALNSLTGQAINYANLGSIFESKGQTDSAWAYYRKSMELNSRDGNTLGIALCHTYFGTLYEKAHELDKALAQYNEAYRLMRDSKDEWHMLNSLTALAGVYIAKGNDLKARQYLAEAMAIATNIHSTEHQAEIYTLNYKLRKSRGDWRGALTAHERAAALQDSLIDMEKVNRMQSVSYNIERGQQARRMTAANDRLSQERSARYAGYVVFALIIILLAVVIALLIYNRRLRNRSYDTLKRLNKVRESFFTNITHEFRTPLTVILGLTHDLQQDNITTDEIKDMGATIERQGNRMLRLINQLLDISKIRSAIGEPEWQRGNIVAYVNMIVESFEDYASSRGIKLQFMSRETEIETAYVPDYINKIMSNLLSNALKFTPPQGKVNVNMWQEGLRLCLDVSDTGRGIPKASLPHIFEPFYQSDNIDGVTGTGVGLALVRQIVEQLGGTISVDSTEGKGTMFHIVLVSPNVPKGEAVTAPSHANNGIRTTSLLSEEQRSAQSSSVMDSMEETENALPSEEPRTASLLIIDDNADVAAFIGKRLGEKYHIVYAHNGKEGLAIAHDQLPDAIVTDLMMPKMDGLELTRRLRADELTSHIPIIIVTAKVTEADRISGLEAGADAYLTKPFSSDELLTRVDKLLEQRALLRKKFSGEAFEGSLAQPGKGEKNGVDAKFIIHLTDCIYVILNAGKPADVNTVADRMHVSYSQLYRKLLALTGLTPVQYIQRVKIAKAKRMLAIHPEMGLNAVSEQCGFSDYSNFVRAFKNVCGITPTQFIRSANNDS